MAIDSVFILFHKKLIIINYLRTIIFASYEIYLNLPPIFMTNQVMYVFYSFISNKCTCMLK